jgi:hypothetical protein
MRLAAVEAAAEAEMARRYHSALVSVDGRATRPGTAPTGSRHTDDAPATRPSSGVDLGFDREALKEALMKGHRVGSGSLLSRPSSGMSNASGAFSLNSIPADTSSLFAAKLRNHRVQPELHVRGDSGSFFQSGNFRSLYNQLQQSAGKGSKSISEAAWDRAALESLDHSITHGGLENIEEVRKEIDTKFVESVGGDKDDERILSSAKARLQFFTRQIEERLAPFPGLSNLQHALAVEYNRYIQTLESSHDVSAASVSRQALEECVVAAAEAKRELLTEKQRNAELKLLVEKLTAANKDYETSDKELQKYIFELRLLLSTSSNASLKSTTALLPDTESSNPSAFIEAMRRLVGEVNTLRQDNMRLAESSAAQLEQLEAQNNEMYEVLSRGNAFQQQVGQLKATVRVMKDYIERLEGRIRELRNVHEENEKMRINVGERMAVLRKELALPYEYGAHCTQHALLQLKGITFACPAEYSDGPVVPEGAMPLAQLVLSRLPRRPVNTPHQAEDEILIQDEALDETTETQTVLSDGQTSAASETFTARPPPPITGNTPDTGVPLHLHSRFAKVKLKMMSFAEVKTLCNDALQDFNNSNASWQSKDPFRLLVPFDVYAKDWFAKRHRSERSGSELAMSLFYWAFNYRHKCTEALLFYRVSCSLVCGTVFLQIPIILQSIKSHLTTAVDQSARRGKDRVTREAFVAAVMACFPLAGPAHAEALAAATVISQERFAEDVSYDGYFDKAATGATLVVYDELVRLILTHVELFHCTLEEKLYAEMRKLSDARFEAMKRMRDDNGVSGKVGLNPLLIESASADHSGKVDVATFARALQQVDPHCRRRVFLDRIATAARAPEYVRSVRDKDKAAQESLMAQLMDVTTLLKNFRTGILPTVAAPLAPGEVDEPFPK